jgi:hypothetical protein
VRETVGNRQREDSEVSFSGRWSRSLRCEDNSRAVGESGAALGHLHGPVVQVRRACFWLAAERDDLDGKHGCLEAVLELNQGSQAARARLAVLYQQEARSTEGASVADSGCLWSSTLEALLLQHRSSKTMGTLRYKLPLKSEAS